MTLYLDAAASDGVDQDVIDAMVPFLTQAYANPSSVHTDGKTAAQALAAARGSIAQDLGAKPTEVIFTSGGTESDNAAIKGIALAEVRRSLLLRSSAHGSDSQPSDETAPRRILISAVEHPAVSESAQWLHDFFGFDVVRIPVDAQAHIDLTRLQEEAAKGATLACIMMANNEVGTIEPVKQAIAICHSHGVPVHVDAVQAVGTIPVDFHNFDADTLAASGHKFGAPKGLGILCARSRVALEPLMSGGGQERGIRSGTPNVAGAVGLAVALHEACERMHDTLPALESSRDALIRAVLDAVPFAQLTGDPHARLPGHASFVFPGINAEALLVDLDTRGIEVSSGSACAIGRSEAPSTLLAMGFTETEAKSALRMSFREPLSPADITLIAQGLRSSLAELHIAA
ncbi:MAG: cysteine desulfurase family protein [Bifidobacteriaceae bacterium]|nr:cysteine desulfurase family protein [Bifidobacteriaceae bacterium]